MNNLTIKSPRPRRSLFSYTRKKVYDMLLQRFTKFEVSQDSLSSTAITFKYFGNCYICIEDNLYVPAVRIAAWTMIDGRWANLTVLSHTERGTINRRFTEILAGIDAVCEVKK